MSCIARIGEVVVSGNTVFLIRKIENMKVYATILSELKSSGRVFYKNAKTLHCIGSDTQMYDNDVRGFFIRDTNTLLQPINQLLDERFLGDDLQCV